MASKPGRKMIKWKYGDDALRFLISLAVAMYEQNHHPNAQAFNPNPRSMSDVALKHLSFHDWGCANQPEAGLKFGLAICGDIKTYVENSSNIGKKSLGDWVNIVQQRINKSVAANYRTKEHPAVNKELTAYWRPATQYATTLSARPWKRLTMADIVLQLTKHGFTNVYNQQTQEQENTEDELLEEAKAAAIAAAEETVRRSRKKGPR
jgi:hypothetical protein